MKRSPIIGLLAALILCPGDMGVASPNSPKSPGECRQEMPNLRREAQQHPNSGWHQQNLALNLLCQNNVKEALPLLQRLPTLFPPQSYQLSESYYRLAEALFRHNSKDDVYEILERGVNASLDRVERSAEEKQAIAWLKLGELYLEHDSPQLRLSHLQKAQQAFEISSQLDPNNDQSYQYLSQVLAEQGQLEKAAESYQAFLESSPRHQGLSPTQQNAWRQVFIGNHYQRRGELETAAQAYNDAIKAEPNLYLAYKGLGETYALQKDYSRAVQVLQEGFTLWARADDSRSYTPQMIQSKVYYELGRFLRQQSQWKAAATATQTSFDIFPPADLERIYFVAFPLIKLQQPKKARLAYLNYIRQSDRYTALTSRKQEALSYHRLGNLLSSLHPEESIKAYKRAFQLDQSLVPNIGSKTLEANPSILLEVITLYEQAIEIQPREKWLRQLARLYAQQGNWDQTLASFIKAYQHSSLHDGSDTLSPALHARAYSDFAATLIEGSYLQQAIDAYQRALDFTPNSAGLLIALGNTQWDQGNTRGALHTFQKALSLEKKRPEVFNAVGLLHMTQGDYADAVEAFRQVLQLSPHDHEAQLNLKAAQKKQNPSSPTTLLSD